MMSLPDIPSKFVLSCENIPDTFTTVWIPLICALIMAAATVGAVFLTALGILISQVFIKPWTDIDALRQEIQITLDTYCNIYTRLEIILHEPSRSKDFKDWEIGQRDLRFLANRLSALERSYIFHFKGFRFIHGLINAFFFYNLGQAHRWLMNLSNNPMDSELAKIADFKIRTALKLGGGITDKSLINEISISQGLGPIDDFN